MAKSTHNQADLTSDTRRQTPSQAGARRAPAAAGPSPAQLSATIADVQSASPADILALQQRFGNQAVSRLIQRAGGDDQPQSTPTSGFDLNTARGLYKHLARLYHPDKARNESEVAWRSELMSKINGSMNDLAALKRLQAEGERRLGSAPTTPTAPSTPPTTPPTTRAIVPSTPPETSTELVLAPVPSNQNSLVLADNSSSQALQQLVTTNPEPVPGGAPAPTSGPRVNNLRMQLLAHNNRVLPFLKKYMTEQHAASNYNFYFDTRNNKTLYNTYVVSGSPQQVPLSPALKSQLDGLAQSRNWAGMAPLIDQARVENQERINTQYLQGFQQTPEYQQVMQTRDQAPLTRLAKGLAGAVRGAASREEPVIGPQLPRQMQQTGRVVATLEQAMERYTRYFDNGKRSLAATGLPENPAARQRLLREGQQRHSRVVSVFTRRYGADPTFRKDRYAVFFNKLSAFTKLWTEYKALFAR